MGGTSRVADADLYLATVGRRCVGCGSQEGEARIFMPPHELHIGNIVVLCGHCEKDYRPMSIDVFATIAMAKYEIEEKVFGFRLPAEPDRQFELHRARRQAESAYQQLHPDKNLGEAGAL